MGGVSALPPMKQATLHGTRRCSATKGRPPALPTHYLTGKAMRSALVRHLGGGPVISLT